MQRSRLLLATRYLIALHSRVNYAFITRFGHACCVCVCALLSHDSTDVEWITHRLRFIRTPQLSCHPINQYIERDDLCIHIVHVALPLMQLF